MLDEFPIRGWRTYLLNCLNDEILAKKYSAVMNAKSGRRDMYIFGLPGPRLKDWLNDEMIAKKYAAEINTNTARRELYYYGLHGDEHDQALFSTKYPNTRDMFLTRSLISIIEDSKTYLPIDINRVMDTCDIDQIMKLIELRRF